VLSSVDSLGVLGRARLADLGQARLMRGDRDDNRIPGDCSVLVLDVVGIVMVVRYLLLMLCLISVFQSVGSLVVWNRIRM